MAFRIPHARDDDYQYNLDGFELTGWIVDPQPLDGADTHDPFAAAVRYPPTHPSEDIVRMLGVTPDADMRAWARGGRPVLRSRVWNDTSDAGQGRLRGRRGQRLQIRRDLLQELLHATGRSLIVEVMIDRTHQRLKQSHTPVWRHHDDDSLPSWSGPSKFTSSMSQEDAESFERTLELGKEIAQDLSDSDVLGRWMAHHISDLIVRAENATDQQTLELRRETADTIIRLWAHRSAAPLHSRPTEALQPVMETLVRLEQDEPWRFYGMFPAGSEPSDDTTRTTLLRFALELEETVRDVVRHVIVVAAEQAAHGEAKWLRLTEHLAEDDQRHLLRLIRHMGSRLRTDDTDTADTDDTNQQTHSISALRKAEKRMAEVRRALEKNLAATTDEVTGDHTS